ncbi:FAD binding domain-containing protein [Planomonospora parontospora]|uniref:FAD binding domain-containing protein n=1 Tax=Planomonospora parontospora TaxID=58119 RepID=UPI00166F91F1|nr:FAD binding domain-containing protein [Planomonospora parontospora]GGL25918.1 carbon monoxide dehydrogenase [Planomonospora parontospora subsp. antibiotica]GII16047.1 carbon monoxide dehydrogenase [Planomonospora parontospora subsp. antibiotica]
MKPPPFDYHAPRTLGEALDVLAGTGEQGKVLAGGQSLIPLMNMRLAAPAHLVDVNRLDELAVVEAGPDGVRVGALARHAQVERSAGAAAVQPLLRQALRLVAHPVIRNRGTAVGSLVHADPAAELPAVLALLGGSVRLARRGGMRDVAAGEFFTGPLESALRPGELAVSAFFPALPARSGTAFREVSRRHGDYALAGVAALVRLDGDGRVAAAKAACVSAGPVPVVVDVTAACGAAPAGAADWEAAARAVRERIEPEDDIHATADYRRHLTGVLAARALREAARTAVENAVGDAVEGAGGNAAGRAGEHAAGTAEQEGSHG